MLTARDIMSDEIYSTKSDVNLEEVIRTLVDNRISGMPVVDDADRVIGVISERDLLNFIFSGNLQNTTVAEAMTKDVTTFPPDTAIDKLSLIMAERKIRRIPIVENEKLVGVVSRRSIIRIVLDMPKKK